MLSTMVHPQDTIRAPRSYNGEADQNDRPTGVPEPSYFSVDRLPNHEEEASQTNGSERDEHERIHSGPRFLSQEETIELASRAVESGIQETKRSLAGNEVVSDVVKPKLTIDLGHSNIVRVPEAVVDVVKNDVERLSLSNNHIFHIPYRFAECSHLRYLNIRANNFREFPKGVYKLPLLEILDISRNKISKLPNEIRKLSSLRVLSAMQNHLEELPLELSDMSKLQILKIAGNPLRYPLRGVLENVEAEMTPVSLADNEKEVALTAEIKRFLKMQQPVMPIDIDILNEASDSLMDTPKPFKRGLNSRFPVIPSTGDGPSDARSARPPPFSMRSHSRMASGQNFAFQNGIYPRPGPSPYVGSSERNRSNSEGIIQASIAARNKRMGAITRKNQNDLSTLNEYRPYRNSHLRGLSYGSVLRTRPSHYAISSGPTSPVERRRLREGFVNRMSSLPEHRGEKETTVPLIEGAKGILFALFQTHFHISTLVSVAKHDEFRRNSLGLVFYNASTHVDRLNEAIERALDSNPEDANSMRVSYEAVKRECETCVGAYTHVGTQLRNSMNKIVANSDPRYVRSLMLMIYGSLIELRNACMCLDGSQRGRKRPSAEKPSIPENSTELSSQDRFSGKTITPARDQVVLPRRLRSETVVQHPPTPANGQNASSGFASPYLGQNGRSRSSSRSNHPQTPSVPSPLATPRSQELFLPTPNSVVSRINPLTGLEEIEEERIFEKIFHQLSQAYAASLQALPSARRQFARCLEIAEQSRESEAIQLLWNNLIRRCRSCLEVSETLGHRLMNMKVKEPGGGMRNQREFWQLCKAFMQSFVDLATDMRDVRKMHVLPSDVIVALRPVQKACRDAGRLIEASPWSCVADMTAPTNHQANFYGQPLQSQHPQHRPSGSSSSANYPANFGTPPLHLPATPLSAALGPAAQATVPSTPASAYSDKFFEGDVFQRADSLLSMPNQNRFFRK